MSNALIVVDVQKDFVEGGSLAVEGGAHIADVLSTAIVPLYQELGHLVLYTKDWHINPGEHFSETPDYVDSWPVHCVANSEGAEFAEDFPVDDPAHIFYKGEYRASYTGVDGFNRRPNGQKGCSLVEALKDHGITTVDVVGIAYDYCVMATAIDLENHGFKVNVLRDFTASVHPENNNLTRNILEDNWVTVLDSDDFVEVVDKQTA